MDTTEISDTEPVPSGNVRPELTPDQFEMLERVGINADSLKLIPGKSIHAYMISDIGWTDGEYLVFIDIPMSSQKKFLYYIGEENDAELVAHWQDVTVWGNVEGRMERFAGLSGEEDE